MKRFRSGPRSGIEPNNTIIHIQIGMSIDIIRTPMETRRDTAKQATRSALIQAALRLFQEEGFDGPSLDAICAAAGYTRGAFYVHFKDREDLVATVMGETLQALLDRVIDPNSENDGSLLQTVVQYVNNTLVPLASTTDATGPRFHQFLEACHRSPAVRNILQETIRQAVSRVGSVVRSGQGPDGIREDMDADGLASVLVLLALGSLVAVDVQLDMKLEETRDAALRLLRSPS